MPAHDIHEPTNIALRSSMTEQTDRLLKLAAAFLSNNKSLVWSKWFFTGLKEHEACSSLDVILYGSWKQGQRPLIHGGAAHSRRYLFHSLTLRWLSEHTIEGFHYPFETQVLHVSAEYSSLEDAIKEAGRDPLAILGVVNLYKFGADSQSCIRELLRAVSSIGIGNRSIARIPLSDFSPPFKEYVCYQGSLTTPPCTESVLWMVRARSLSITRETAEAALGLLAPSGDSRRSFIRHPQPLNDRRVYIFN